MRHGHLSGLARRSGVERLILVLLLIMELRAVSVVNILRTLQMQMRDCTLLKVQTD